MADIALKRLVLPDNIASRRIVIISNRPPYTIKVLGGKKQVVKGTGGLVTALDPVMKKTGGVWSALIRGDDKILPPSIKIDDDYSDGPGYRIRYVRVDPSLVSGFYLGFSNSTLWPLFHSFLGRTVFEKESWETYCKVNESAYRTISRQVKEGDLVWVHDYHFLLLPHLFREGRKKVGVGFFLHIPFPPVEILRALPWAKNILIGMLGADIIGFHTDAYLRNFFDSVEDILGARLDRRKRYVYWDGRKIRCGSFPISIDYERFRRVALSKETEHRVKGIRNAFRVDNIIIGVDRLDYTKGFVERLMAVERFLEKYPGMRKNFVFIQLTVPSREKVSEYEEMRRTIDEMVGRINGLYAEGGWVPIHYYYRSLNFPLLIAYYRASDAALVTPLKDGMNLVAKEYVVSHNGLPGSLILSELAGAAVELKEAHLVNPYDIEGMADTLYESLISHGEKRSKEIALLNRRIFKNDIYAWLNSFLSHWSREIV